jgi:hypothetical protein
MLPCINERSRSAGMYWTALTVPVVSIAKGEGVRIPKVARSAFSKHGDDPKLAMFSALLPEKRSVVYYLSPAVVTAVPELIATLGAVPSDPPPRDAPLVAGVVGTRVADLS